MSSTKFRPFLAVALAALALRAGVAVLTEYKPIFPSYYYTDAELIDETAWKAVENWSEPDSLHLPGSVSQLSQVVTLAGLYKVVGHRPLAAKFIIALIAASAILLWGLLEPVLGLGACLATALLLCVWPSHIFFTSQIFKEAPTLFLISAPLFLAARGLEAGESGWGAPSAAFVCLMLSGFLRGYIMLVAAGAIALASAFAGLKAIRAKHSTAFALAWFAVALGSPLAYKPISKALFLNPGAPFGPSPNMPGDLASRIDIAPTFSDPNTTDYRLPLTPRGISEFRYIRQTQDRHWAEVRKGRQIGTQLFYGLKLDGWGDLFRFLPKAVFYVLFMPLPLLYPIGHNIGRALASGENLILLVLCAAGAAGFLRSRKTPARLLLGCFFLFMACGSGLLEFDLGSATRHRLLFMPLLFPFAFTLVFPENRKAAAGKRKVFQVLECGGPGGTGNQVAAICNGLDPARFDVALAYASRDANPQDYRAQAPGARQAFYVPELRREISPAQDLRAFWKLRRLFLKQAPDVVHAHSSKAGFVARLAARSAGVPAVFYSPHGYGFLQRDRSNLSRGIYRLAEWSVSWIGTIVAVSPSEAALARPLAWGRPVETVCDGYLGPKDAAPEAHDHLVVGGCGRMTAARDTDAFVKLCQRVTDSRNGLRCVWIGGGENEAKVRRDLENMNLTGKVEITGWLPSDAARRRLRSVDIFVHYSRWDALPNAALEAMALGLPVVAADVPGCRDVVEHGKTGFLAATEPELLERVLALVDDPDLRRRLGEAGKRRVDEVFSFSDALVRLQALYLN